MSERPQNKGANHPVQTSTVFFRRRRLEFHDSREKYRNLFFDLGAWWVAIVDGSELRENYFRNMDTIIVKQVVYV